MFSRSGFLSNFLKAVFYFSWEEEGKSGISELLVVGWGCSLVWDILSLVFVGFCELFW